LLAFAKRHVGLLPVRSAAGEAALPLDLAVRDARPDAIDLRAEQLLDGAADLRLVCRGRDLEDDRPSVLTLDRGLLSNRRPPNDICRLHDPPPRVGRPFQGRQPIATLKGGRATRAPPATSRAPPWSPPPARHPRPDAPSAVRSGRARRRECCGPSATGCRRLPRQRARPCR